MIRCFCTGENDFVDCLRKEKNSPPSPKDEYNFPNVLKCGSDKQDNAEDIYNT